jgi:hypothetical protein
MQAKFKHRNTIAAMLLLVSLFSFIPTFTSADQQTQTGTTVISLSGQAIPFDPGNGTGQPTSASLELVGLAQKVGDAEFALQNLTGFVQIGSANYTVTSGQGDVHQDGQIWITANTTSNFDDHQLVLNGGIQGNTLSFPAPSSRLSTQFFLGLTGGITMNDYQGNNMLANVMSGPNGSTPMANNTLSQNSTATANLLTASNATAQMNATLTNVTTSQSASYALTQQNVTVAQTLSNQTITVFVTQTITSTVANVTITQSTVTTSVANTTVTVTNSTVSTTS